MGTVPGQSMAAFVSINVTLRSDGAPRPSSGLPTFTQDQSPDKDLSSMYWRRSPGNEEEEEEEDDDLFLVSALLTW